MIFIEISDAGDLCHYGMAALASVKLKVDGSWLKFLAFNRRFELK